MQTQAAWSQQLDQTVDAQRQRMIEVRRHLHANPELSGAEIATTRYLADRLADAGVTSRIVADGCGLIADADTEDDPTVSQSPRIAMRADMDALRIQDGKSVEYASRVPGVMHACGHDGHTAVVFGAALGLAEAERNSLLPWPVNWRAVFQPAEETNEGALRMIEAGAIDGVEAILSLHMDPSRPAGAIGLRAGTFTADCDEIEIRITGRGGHAARPHESLDPIATAAQLISAIYLFVPRGADSLDPVVVTIGQIHGGETPNVIPDEVVLRGTMRSFSSERRQRTLDHIRQLSHGIADATGTSIELRLRSGPPSVYNDAELTGLIRISAVELLGEDNVQSIPKPSMGGEDFANYLAHVPGSMFRLGCAASAEGAPPLHSPRFDIDERALTIGAKILARTVVNFSDPARH